MKVKKELVAKILFLLFSIVIIHLFFFYSVPSYRCGIEGGKEVWIDGLDITTCLIKTNDHGKYCIDNLSCEGYCIIKNKDVLEKKWIELFGDKAEEVKIEKFEEKAQIEIEGYCSKFRAGPYCGDDYGFFKVENGLIKKNVLAGWRKPMIDCNSYFKD